jgi:hypothetical protein
MDLKKNKMEGCRLGSSGSRRRPTAHNFGGLLQYIGSYWLSSVELAGVGIAAGYGLDDPASIPGSAPFCLLV